MIDARIVHPLPPSLSFAQGAAVGVPCSTAWRALFQKAGVDAGETVLVHGGSGGVGTAAVQLARAAGLTVIATAGSAKGLALVTEQGAHHAVDHSQPDYRAAIEAAAAAAARTSSSRCWPTSTSPTTSNCSRRAAASSSSAAAGSLDFTPRAMMAKDAIVTGMTLPNMTAGRGARRPRRRPGGPRRGHAETRRQPRVAAGRRAQAHELVMTGGATGKIVLVP